MTTKKRETIAKLIIFIFFSLLVVFFSLAEFIYGYDSIAETIGLSGIPVILSMIAGGPIIGVLTSFVWSLMSLVLSGNSEGLLQIVVSSRILFVLAMWFSYKSIKLKTRKRKYNLYLAILIGIASKVTHLYIYKSLIAGIDIPLYQHPLIIVIVQSIIYVFSVNWIFRLAKQYIGK